MKALTLGILPFPLWANILGYADMHWQSEGDIFSVIEEKLIPLIQPNLPALEYLTLRMKNYFLGHSPLEKLIFLDPALLATLVYDTNNYDFRAQREKLQQFYYMYTRLLHNALEQKDSTEDSQLEAPTLSMELKTVTDLLSVNQATPVAELFRDAIPSHREFKHFIDKMMAGITDRAELKLSTSQLSPRKFIETLAEQKQIDVSLVIRQISINFLQISTPKPIWSQKTLQDPSLNYLGIIDKQVDKVRLNKLDLRESIVVIGICIFGIAILLAEGLGSLGYKNAKTGVCLAGLVAMGFSIGGYLLRSMIRDAQVVNPWRERNADIFPWSDRSRSLLELNLRMDPEWEAKLSTFRNSVYQKGRLELQKQSTPVQMSDCKGPAN